MTKEEFQKLKGRRIYQFYLDEETGKITDITDSMDYVKVIRCKDCKYYFKSDEKCQLIDTRLHFYETDKRWADDSFCSWAERRDNDKSGLAEST